MLLLLLLEEDKKWMWIKYYCEECKVWEMCEFFEVNLLSSYGVVVFGVEVVLLLLLVVVVIFLSVLWLWGCVKFIYYGVF